MTVIEFAVAPVEKSASVAADLPKFVVFGFALFAFVVGCFLGVVGCYLVVVGCFLGGQSVVFEAAVGFAELIVPMFVAVAPAQNFDFAPVEVCFAIVRLRFAPAADFASVGARFDLAFVAVDSPHYFAPLGADSFALADSPVDFAQFVGVDLPVGFGLRRLVLA